MSQSGHDFDEQLRASFERQASHAPQRDLTEGALRQAGRIRRRRRIGVGIAAAAVVAVAVPVGIQVWSDGDPTGQTANQPTATPDTSVEPVGIAEEPLLRDADINPVGTYDGFRLVSEDPLHADVAPVMCLPDLTSVGATTSRFGTWTHPGEATVTEAVLQMQNVEAADVLLSSKSSLPEQCGQIEQTRIQTVSQPAVIDVSDQALAWTVDIKPGPDDPGSEPSFFGIGMAREANVVVVFTFGAFGDPTDNWNDYAAQTLTRALERAVP